MNRTHALAVLVACFFGVSVIAYTDYPRPSPDPPLDELERAGLAVWRRSNCQAFHQVHGFGGFLGPDLTNRATGDADFDEIAQVVQLGRGRMPAFDLPEEDLEALFAWLRRLDGSGRSQPRSLEPRRPVPACEHFDELLGAWGRSRGRDLPDGIRRGLGIWTAMRCGTCHRPFAPGMRRRMIAMVCLWAVAGVGIVVSLLRGHFTGREYLGYSPVFSLLIATGWILFAVSFYRLVGASLRDRPVFVIMWWVAIPLFLVTYAESHLYLLEAVSVRPLRDIAIQWKANGAMVGSFNLLAYGSLIYVVSALQGDETYARSRTAFLLFTVGLLNSFRNYGHHTYHLPQSAWIHWISFVVSMLELVILAKVFLDVLSMFRAAPIAPVDRATFGFVRSANLWTFLMLALPITIAIPPLNALIHGTHVVTAHVMGSMIGIDSMILWAGMMHAVRSLAASDHRSVRGRAVRAAIPILNGFFLVFLVTYLARGVARGWSRHAGPVAPDLPSGVALFPLVMLLSGLGLAATVLWILAHWIHALLFAREGAARLPTARRSGPG